MRFTVWTNFKPAMFSTARLLPKATRPVSTPTRNTNVHLTATYCKISTRFLDLQSCLNRSFSINLHQSTQKRHKTTVFLERVLVSARIFFEKAWDRLMDHHHQLLLQTQTRWWEIWQSSSSIQGRKKNPISPFLHSERTKMMMMIENDLFIFNGHPTELNDGGGFWS